MVWLLARLAKLRKAWAFIAGLFTFVIFPLVRWLWRRHEKSRSKAGRSNVIDVNAEEVKK